jgi:hypothetical protein
MLHTALRFLERAMAPWADLMAKMPASAARQIIFSI